jgi:predicted homoserine dehydrogenase-like protein
MIIVDRALAERERSGDPIRVGLVGAGFMGRGIALQIVTATPGMELVAIANRALEPARRAFIEAGVAGPVVVTELGELEEAVTAGRPAVTEDAGLVARAEGIEAVVEVTGAVEFAARVILTSIEHKKHVVLMNAEVDGTVGPILKARAGAAGVVYTNADGDQPGVIMNLYRFVTGIGVRPVLCGNVKGLHDPYRTPTTQAEFARRWGQKPQMVTAFADGTKVSFEQAIVANATGMRVGRRGMFGPSVEPGTPIERAAELFPADVLLEEPGIVDYVVGASPNPGVFVLGTHDHPTQQHYLNLYKLGEGPFYCFYTPYHLCHFELPATVVRAVDFADAAITPAGGVCVDVVAVAKRDLEGLLPIGLAEGCQLRRDIAQDELVHASDVERPPGRLVDRLRAEQDALFAAPAATDVPLLR